jgi:tetratricopeptide (TPR) repeat protein
MKSRLRAFAASVLVLVLAALSAWAGQSPTAAKLAERGWQTFQNGDANDAKASLTEAIRLSPRQPKYHAALAEIELSLGDAQRAMHHYEIACELDPSNTEVRSRLAQLYQSLNRDLDVLRILRPPDPPEPLQSLWRFSRGVSLFRLGRLNAARREFQPLVNHRDFEGPVNFFLGRIAYTQNRFDEALPFFAKAVRLSNSPTNKEFSSYAYNYGLALFRLGRFSEANEQFILSTERFALEPLAWMMRGRSEEELKNYHAAIDDYEESIKLDPTFELSYYHLARLQQRYGDSKKAEELFKHLGELRQSDIKEAQIRAEEQALLRMKTGGSRARTPVPAP